MTWEYLAGFFDGEGCIHYMVRPYGRYVAVHVSQGHANETQSQVCRTIHSFLRSHEIQSRLVHYGPGKSGKGPTSRVLVTKTDSARRWLEGMLPFLVVKKQQAIAAIAHCANIPSRKSRLGKEASYGS